jgi:4-amino-4-deoxy-L-arabinose transferase-like glycosyltransferase
MVCFVPHTIKKNYTFANATLIVNFMKYIQNSWKYLLLFFLLSVPIFAQLGTFPIRVWDEARLAVNAYEMYHNGSYLIPTFEGEPDMWNSKPPLMIWFQVVSMKIFGINEFAVRFPSALAAILTCITLLFFSLKYLKNFWFGFCCILVLATSQGYVYFHSIRTGDYDALLTFFTTLGYLSFFAFTETFKKKYIYIFFLSLALCVLTKSITGLIFLPALLIYISIRKQWLLVLKNKHFYFALLGFLFITVGYYVIREIQNPGYFYSVRMNELGGRFLSTIEGHKYPFDFYFTNLMDD